MLLAYVKIVETEMGEINLRDISPQSADPRVVLSRGRQDHLTGCRRHMIKKTNFCRCTQDLDGLAALKFQLTGTHDLYRYRFEKLTKCREKTCSRPARKLILRSPKLHRPDQGKGGQHIRARSDERNLRPRHGRRRNIVRRQPRIILE